MVDSRALGPSRCTPRRGSCVGVVAHVQTEEVAREVFAELVCESGRALFLELAAPWLDRAKAARVDFAAVTAPVLVINGELDLIVPARLARRTASRYQRGSYVEIPDSDHLVFHGGRRRRPTHSSATHADPALDTRKRRRGRGGAESSAPSAKNDSWVTTAGPVGRIWCTATEPSSVTRCAGQTAPTTTVPTSR